MRVIRTGVLFSSPSFSASDKLPPRIKNLTRKCRACKMTAEVRTTTTRDRSLAVSQVRQQFLFRPRPEEEARKCLPFPPPKDDPSRVR